VIVIGLDPGYEVSAIVVWDTTAKTIIQHGEYANGVLLDKLRGHNGADGSAVLVIEQIESFGMAVGKTTFETVYMSGRFAEAWFPKRVERLPRKVIKLQLCGQVRAKDGEIRQAIVDRFGPTKEKAVGTRKLPGPLYGVSKHEWSALAVALTWADQIQDAPTGDIVRPGVAADF